MNNIFNLLLFEYALNALKRRGAKNLFVVVIFSLLIALLSSIFFIANALKYELDTTVEALPEIIVQKIKAGRQYDIETDRADAISEIAGVESTLPRIWGYYYFENAGVNFSVVGVDLFEESYKKRLTDVIENITYEKFEQQPSMVVGAGVKEILQANYYRDYFNFIKPDGTFKKLHIAGTFDTRNALETNDIILVKKEIAREIFDIDEGYATDIIVKVPNPEEIPTIVQKIKMLFPDTRVVAKEDLKVSYQNIFDYKSGLFLSLFIIALFTFFIIIYDKVSGLSSEEKKEIGILKAIGWKIDDVLVEKFYEAGIISITSFLIGLTFAIFYVYGINAPLLKEVFVGYSTLKPPFNLPFILDTQTIMLTFFLTVPIYIAACIIPSWRAATLEADEVIR